MNIVFLTTAHNSLSQRAFVELVERGHRVVVVIASSEAVMIEAVEREHPDLIVAPMLKKVIPGSIWQNHTCIIIHPGIKGDRRPSFLDWAILNAYEEWGVTLLQANAEMDAGPIWAARTFAMRAGSKSDLYRHEVTEAAIQGLLETIAKVESHTFLPEPLDYGKEEVKGRLQAPMKQADRAIDWRESTASVLKKIRCADSFPGVLDTVLGMPCYLYGAHAEGVLKGVPGEILATRDGAICRATGDGAVWITYVSYSIPQGRSLYPNSTAVLHTSSGVQLCSHGPIHQGVLTSRPFSPSLAGHEAFASRHSVLPPGQHAAYMPVLCVACKGTARADR